MNKPSKRYRIAIRVVSVLSIIGLVAPSLVFPRPAGAAAPVIHAVADMEVTEGFTASQFVTASDFDGDTLTFLNDGVHPSFMFVFNVLDGIGKIELSPSFSQAGVYTGNTITVTDGVNTVTSNEFNITVLNNDRPPVVTAPAVLSVVCNNLTSFAVSAADPDNQPMTSLAASGTAFDSLVTGNPTATFSASPTNTSGTFAWTPRQGLAGTFTAVFTATAGGVSRSVTTTINVTCVTPVDHPPILDPIGSKDTLVGVALDFDINANDEDNDVITYTSTASPDIYSLPYTAQFDETTGHFSWTPGPSDAGNYSVTFCAWANGVSDCETITITVERLNHPPVLDSIDPDNRVIYHNDLLDVTVHGSDQDGDAVVYTARPYQGAIENPALTWLGRGFRTDEFNTHTGQLTWTPGPDRDLLGTHEILFCVYSTPDLHDCKILTVTILNRTPQIDNFEPATISLYHNEMLVVSATGTDGDGDTPTFTARAYDPNNPDDPAGNWLGGSFTEEEFVKDTGQLRWTPGPIRGLLGEHVIHFCMYDYEGKVFTCTDLTVNILNHRPEIDRPIAPKTVFRGDRLTFTVTATDLDNDAPLVFTRVDSDPIPGSSLSSASFDNDSGAFSWQTSPTEPLGDRSVHFCVYDYEGRVFTCTDVTITVANHPPIASFATSPLCYSIPVRFNGTTSYDPDGSIATSSWDFGDSSPILTSSLEQYHTYTGTGPYTATLTVVDNEGATESTERAITIGAVTMLQGSPIPGGSKARYQLGNTYGFSLDFLPPSGTTLDKLDLAAGNIWLQSNGTGSVTQIQPTQVQNVWGVFGAATFAPGDLDALFANVFASTDPKGTEKNLPMTLLVPLKVGGCQYVQVQFTVTVKKK